MKRLLVGMRKAITPQRDMFASLVGGVSALPGMTEEDERYFRDIYDHLLRISDLIDTYRDLLTSSMDVYLSTVSNRLNSVMKQLTVMATIFLRSPRHRLLRPELRLAGRPHPGGWRGSSSSSASVSRSRRSRRSSSSSSDVGGSDRRSRSNAAATSAPRGSSRVYAVFTSPPGFFAAALDRVHSVSGMTCVLHFEVAERSAPARASTSRERTRYLGMEMRTR